MSSRNSSVSSFGSQVHDSSSSISTCSSNLDEPLISGLHHINLLVPPQTLHLARDFYAGSLGLHEAIVPASCKAYLAWFDIATSGQQIHITSQHQLNQVQMQAQSESPRHPCFKISTQEKLDKIQQILWQLHERGGEGAPVYCDEPSSEVGEAQKAPGGFPRRFFARDYAGNRLEFSL